MKKPVKIIITSIAMLLVVSAMVVGVWAASLNRASFSIGVSYSPTDVVFSTAGNVQEVGRKIKNSILPYDDHVGMSTTDFAKWDLSLQMGQVIPDGLGQPQAISAVINYYVRNESGRDVYVRVNRSITSSKNITTQITVNYKSTSAFEFDGDFDYDSLVEGELYDYLDNNNMLSYTSYVFSTADAGTLPYDFVLLNNLVCKVSILVYLDSNVNNDGGANIEMSLDVAVQSTSFS